MCPSVDVEGVAGISSGLKLMITRNDEAPTTVDYSDTSDYSALYKSLRVVSGQPFRLQWNIDPASEFDTCYFITTAPSQIVPDAGNESGSGLFNTTGVPADRYIFNLTCSKGAAGAKTSSVKLQIVNSSLEEI
jgi:hypothetical protein